MVNDDASTPRERVSAYLDFQRRRGDRRHPDRLYPARWAIPDATLFGHGTVTVEVYERLSLFRPWVVREARDFSTWGENDYVYFFTRSRALREAKRRVAIAQATHDLIGRRP